MSEETNKEQEDLSIQDNVFDVLCTYSDLFFILDLQGNYSHVSVPENNKFKLDSESILNKHYSKVFISNDYNTKLENKLQELKEKLIDQEFNFTINHDSKEYLFKAKLSKINSKSKQVLCYIVAANNLESPETTEDDLKNAISRQKTRIKELERDINFYIKQGDLITNQRTRIQKERDQLALDKAEIAKQKEFIEKDLNFIMKQGDKIAEQKYKIEKQHDLVRQQNKKIEDSILYAKRIQSAVLPPNRFIQHLLTNHFIFYKPRDIVSGDFYWIKQVDEKIFIAAADCTGHGVPGALMSMLGITFLNEIVNKDPNIHANEILDELRIHIISSLRQTGSSGESRDGLDIALCVLNHKDKILEYSGANNPLYFIRNNEFSEIKPDRMPIGYHRRAKESFQNHIIKLQKDDLIYIFSDGYVDQFGGADGRKYLSSNFRKLLIDNCSKSLLDQKGIIEKTFEDWKGERKQLDDILVIGFKIGFEKEEIISKQGYDWTGKTILIAEDNEANFLLLQKALEKTNVTIIHAENGKEAINLFKANPEIDVILMDIRMPILDGIEATTQIKQIDRSIPIIVQTAFTMSTEKEKSFKAGCDDYISKPINLKELYATVCKYIEK